MAALVLAFALALAPIVSALTHGLGQLEVEVDHAAWHAEQGGHLHSSDQGHHDTADHDHMPTVILPVTGGLSPPLAIQMWASQARPLGSTIRDGPRRPPRLI